MKNNKTGLLIGAIIFFVVVSIIAIAFSGASSNSGNAGTDEPILKEETFEQKLSKLRDKLGEVPVAEPVMGQIGSQNFTLYDEMPEIDKYPLAVDVTGRYDIVIEIMSSGEKAGKGNNAWLIDVAESFNKNQNTTSTGQTIGVNVRSVPSGTGADYIASNKYVPDMWTPSNTLFGNYAIANGAAMEIYKNRLVGNTAGILVDKKSSLKTVDDVIASVRDGALRFGYTNPQTSASGVNLLLLLLNTSGGDINSDKAFTALTEFNKNIPYIAYTTQQMITSASSGTLESMIAEYQDYVNNQEIVNEYTFIPFGMRHDNPVYITNKGKKNEEAVKIFIDYCLSDEMQEIATSYGFNQNEDYESSYDATGFDVADALRVYKRAKDSGRPVYAVFVADCSGSMSGDGITSLKESLSNGANYINEENYIGLVSYSSDVTIECPIKKFDMDQHLYFQGAVDRLSADGSTRTYDALVVATDILVAATKDVSNAKLMIFLLSDGQASFSGTSYDAFVDMISSSDIPVYTISYTEDADKDTMKAISDINEAVMIDADTDDIVYKIKGLLNSQM